MRILRNLALVVVFGTGLIVPSSSWSRTLRVTPSQVAIPDPDSTGLCRVFLKFDISALAVGEGRRIEEASIDWKVEGVPSDRESAYQLFLVTSAWSQEAVTEEVAPSARVEPESTWEILPFDYERNGGGFIHLDITHAISEWAAGRLSNFGICIQSRDVAKTALVEQAQAAKLTILYGFVPVIEESTQD